MGKCLANTSKSLLKENPMQRELGLVKIEVKISSRTGFAARATRSIRYAVFSSDNYRRAGLILSNLVMVGRHSESIPMIGLPIRERSY